MKQIHRNVGLAALSAALLLGPSVGWSTRAFSDQVSGTITATPVSETIEVDHHVFHIKAGSLAAQAMHGFSEGQKVDLVLDGPPANKATQVLKISAHEGQVNHDAQ
jgi:hypothetical protein